ncbi:mucin-5AC-like [Diachasma alloeum]|uniref:mucin-5AC-like n=1 Tax=Diachasma alloeum TaxID=454923 RepID=UPI0007382E39|nr:mucin-5AC-like [Diachasma alloeum]XP_015112554.1 mucin-5AC-like [Diachasma alloeum]
MVDLDAWKLVLPRELRSQAMAQCHELPQAGHLGVDKTYRRLYVLYYWPNMFRDVVSFVSRCDTCQRCKVENALPRGHMGRRVVQGPWTTVAADIVGSIPPSKTGYSYVLVLQDLFTKWVKIIPLRRTTGKAIREQVENVIISRWGTPRVPFTDNGTEFVNWEIQALAAHTGLKHETSPPYHPQANPDERVNRILKIMLRVFMEGNHRTWDAHLHEFRFTFYTAEHSSLQTTPASANFGRHPLAAVSLRQQLEGDVEVIPGEPLEWVGRMKTLEILRKSLTHALRESSDKQAYHYNIRRRDIEFEEGDLVMKRTHSLSNAAKRFLAALVPPFDGPFIVQRKISRVRYQLANFSGKDQEIDSNDFQHSLRGCRHFRESTRVTATPKTRNPAPRKSGVVKTEEPSSVPSSSTKEVSQEEQDFVAALWPNGAPPELADFHFPNLEQKIQALSPRRSPYHPKTEAISRPNTPNPSGTQPGYPTLEARTSQAPNPATTAPSPTPPNVELGSPRAIQPVVLLERIQVPPPVLRIEDYWEPLEPWLPDVWSVERKKKGFMRALQACSLQPLCQITEHRYIIPPIHVPVEPDGVHPLVLANLIDPAVMDHEPPRTASAHSPRGQAPVPPSPRSPTEVVASSDASSSSSSSSASSTSSSSSSSTSSSSSVANCSKDEAEQAHQAHCSTEDTPSRSPNRARNGSTSSDQNESSIPLEALRQLPLAIREMLRGYSPVIPITGPTPSTSGSDQDHSPVIPITGPTLSTSGSDQDYSPVIPITGPTPSISGSDQDHSLVIPITGPTPSTSGSDQDHSPVIPITGPTPSTSGSDQDHSLVIPVTGSSPPIKTRLGSGHNTPPAIPTAGQATSTTTQRLPVLDSAARSRSDSAAVPPESSSDSRKLEPTQGDDPCRSTQKKGPSKKRIWCFDCKKHGHRPADCPNPMEETFCDKCPFRVARNRPCPIHGTDLAGAPCSRSASRPAVRSEVFRVPRTLDKASATSSRVSDTVPIKPGRELRHGKSSLQSSS